MIDGSDLNAREAALSEEKRALDREFAQLAKIGDEMLCIQANARARARRYEAALKKSGVNYRAHIYPKVNHGFHNDTTPRYDENAAELAWERTVLFFKTQLAG